MIGALIIIATMGGFWAFLAWSSLRHNRKFDAARR